MSLEHYFPLGHGGDSSRRSFALRVDRTDSFLQCEEPQWTRILEHLFSILYPVLSQHSCLLFVIFYLIKTDGHISKSVSTIASALISEST